MNRLMRITLWWQGRGLLLCLGAILALVGNLTLTMPVGAVTSDQISTGVFHTCSVTTSGGLLCWGHNSSGQLGTSNNISSPVPLPVSGLTSGVSSVSAGAFHTCALLNSGGVRCWGNNASAQLGTGHYSNTNVPTSVYGLSSGISTISVGTNHTCALTNGGGVLCWGANNYGQLGTGDTSSRNVPTSVSGLDSGVNAISAGTYHTCAAKASGAVFCWGYNSSGQLGNGNNSNSTVPVPVSGLSSGVNAISAGTYYTCAVKASGEAFCWGDNSFGQLGTGNTIGSNIPTPFSRITKDVNAIAAAAYHTCAITTSSDVLCWGDNSSGQLGTGNQSNSTMPVPVTGLPSGVKAIDVGGSHTCTLTTAGNILCWGYNGFGQLGNGNHNASNVPTSVETNATIIVVLDIEPGSNANVQFAGDLGNFQLDDPTVDDGDLYTTTKKFVVNPGTYILAEVVPTPYFAGVSCVGSMTRIGQSAVSLTLGGVQNVVCTFTNQRAGQITASTYNDQDHNHVRNTRDEWLSGWTMQLFTSPSAQVGVQTTNTNGSANFPNLRPGAYTVCEEMQAGWFNITPSFWYLAYQKPCYSVTVNPGKVVAVRFGNSTTPLVVAAGTDEFTDVIVTDLPDTDDDGNEVTLLPDPWPDVMEEQVNVLFLPLVSR